MPMACCNRCYQQYIDKDGKLLPEFSDWEYPDHNIGYSTTEWSKSNFTGMPYVEQRILIQDRRGDVEVLCSCPCHVVGACVMH